MRKASSCAGRHPETLKNLDPELSFCPLPLPLPVFSSSYPPQS